jgi:hypothetical protein
MCNYGYAASQSNPTCLAGTATSGSWSDPTGTICLPISNYCPLLTAPTHGSITYPDNNRALGSRALVTCADGFNGNVMEEEIVPTTTTTCSHCVMLLLLL